MEDTIIDISTQPWSIRTLFTTEILAESSAFGTQLRKGLDKNILDAW